MAPRDAKERDVASTDRIKLLSEVPIFEGLSKKELQAIAQSAKEVRHREGAVLAREGDTGLGFFLITDGTARVTVGARSRQRMGPGDFFGEISLLDQGPRTATVTAETAITTLGITAWVFKRLIEQNPSIAAKMLKVMAQRLRQSSREPTH
jgi:CRP/FNR family cyclic AMP-dependent transcriptional regulator